MSIETNLDGRGFALEGQSAPWVCRSPVGARFDGGFPEGGNADVDLRLVVELGLHVVGEDRVVRQPPEHDITHDLNEAMRLGDRIAMMRDGRIVQIGTAEQGPRAVHKLMREHQTAAVRRQP